MTPILRAFALNAAALAAAGAENQPYRLESVDLKQRVLWGAEVRFPDGGGLAFGGQDQDADDGRPHTRFLVDGEWRRIDAEMRESNPNQEWHVAAWKVHNRIKAELAQARFVFFKGTPSPHDGVQKGADALRESLSGLARNLDSATAGDAYAADQRKHASRFIQLARESIPSLADGIHGETLRSLSSAQIQLELAAEALDAEPAPRAIDCGARERSASGATTGNLVYDPKTGVCVLFGGDHLDYLTNDLWVFDPKARRWSQRHPEGAPAPRANHRLSALGDGTLRMTGGYTYASNTDYVGGQYLDLDDGEWIYDLTKDIWFSSDGQKGDLHPPYTRTYRSGPFHPDFFYEGDQPDPTKFGAWLMGLPANEWFPTDPPKRPSLNRDWGVARLDPDRDLMLRWSGGHSAHGGSDVPHFHFSTNRWELPFPVEFPLGQLYSNTSYPNGFNFNRRPWVTGHTYQNYAYDPPSKTMVMAGRPRHTYVYDPLAADWVGRFAKPEAMRYDDCFYTLTLTATPGGAVCWDKNGALHRYEATTGEWHPIETSGDPLPGAYVDHSSICYDSKRDRVLIVNTPGYGEPYTGQVWAVDMKSGRVSELSPEGMEHAARFASIDKSCYDPTHDLLLIGTYIKDAGAQTPTPAYDPEANRWITLDLKYNVEERNGEPARAFPHARSDVLMFDPKRDLIWGVDTNGQVFVLRFDMAAAAVKPLR